MRLRMKEQLICFLLVAILLVMGMQADIAPVNPSFLRRENVAAENSAYNTIREGTHRIEVKSDCTIDMIRRNVSTYQAGNVKRIPVKRFFKIALLLLVAEMLLLQRFFYGAAIERIDYTSIRCHIATVIYIHQKDGKK